MSADLDAYLAGLVQLSALPQEHERALREAARAGQDGVERARVTQRSHCDAIEKSQRMLSTAQDRFRRLELRTGPVEPINADHVPDSLVDLARYIDDILRDLEAAAKAQEWVESTRTDLACPSPVVRPAPMPAAESNAVLPVDEITPARTSGHHKALVIGIPVVVAIAIIFAVILLTG